MLGVRPTVETARGEGAPAGALGVSGAPCADWAFYADEYGGSLPVEAFSAALPAAMRHVRWLCGWRAPRDEGEARAYRRAVCAAADAFAEYGEGQVGGFQIGGFGVTHYDNRGTSGEDMATAAVVKELGGSGLLFGGLR